jgi:hypothetical protein
MTNKRNTNSKQNKHSKNKRKYTKNKKSNKKKHTKNKSKNRNNHKNKSKTKNKILYNIKGGSMKTCACVDYDVINNQYSLQNNPTGKACQNKPIDGSEFCHKHQKCPNFMKTYVNGYEHSYDPKKWNHPYVEGSHNCYTYFLNNQIKAVKERCDELCNKHGSGCPKKIEQCSNLKPQPGHYNNLLKKGNLDMGSNKYTCPLMESRITGDNELIKKVKFNQKCPKYYYKGAMVVDPGHTYHFYRQNQDGTWSHKPGTLPVTNKDAGDKVIYVPHNADRNYNKGNTKDGINYVDFCGYYCVPNNKYLNTHAI